MKILTYPNPKLEEACSLVEPGENIENIISLLKREHKRAKGAGLAAPQVGFNRRVFIGSIKDKGTLQNYIFINPIITPIKEDELTDIVYGNEGCLSIPGKTFNVPRYRKVRIEALNEKRAFFAWELEGDNARLVQHEIDHLDGKLISRFDEVLKK